MSNWTEKLLQRSEGVIKGFVGHEADLVAHAAEQAIVDQIAPVSGEAIVGVPAINQELINELAAKVLAALSADVEKDVSNAVNDALADLKPLTQPVAGAAVTVDTVAAAVTFDNGSQA